MTLFLSNDDIAPLLDPADVVAALDQAYRAHAMGESVCVPRLDLQGPTNAKDETYQLGIVAGLAGSRYGALRIKSDMVFRQLVEWPAPQGEILPGAWPLSRPHPAVQLRERRSRRHPA